MPIATVYSREFYQDISTTSAGGASIIVPRALALVQPRSVVDVGSGEGSWLAEFLRLGVTDVLGLDGNYVLESNLKIPRSLFRPTDLSQPFTVDRQFDLAISLETGEHLPEKRASGFVADIVKLAPQVLFSAAIPFQRGTRHLNCQWPDYWQRLFAEHGYVAFDVIRREIWDDNSIAYWYRQNTILYVRKDRIEQNAVLRPLLPMAGEPLTRMVHPELCNQWDGLYFTEVLKLLGPTFKRAIRNRLGIGSRKTNG